MLVRMQGSTDGGATWEWLKVDSDGHLQADVLSLPTGKMLFSLDAVYHEMESEEDVAAGDHGLDFSAVSSGKIRIVTRFAARSSPSVIDEIALLYNDGVNNLYFYNKLSPASGELVTMEGPLILEVGDYLRAYFLGCTLNDNIIAYANGYEISTT